MKKIRNEGKVIVFPIITFVVVFGSLIFHSWEQDQENRETREALEIAENRVLELEENELEIKGQLGELNHEKENLQDSVSELEDDVSTLKNRVIDFKEEKNEYMDGKKYIAVKTFNIEATAYTQSVEEGTANGITYTGTRVKEGRTIAVDPDMIPLGSLVYIESDSPFVGGFYEAQDIGGAIDGNRVDIYMDSKRQAFKFGRQSAKLTVLKGVN